MTQERIKSDWQDEATNAQYDWAMAKNGAHTIDMEPEKPKRGKYPWEWTFKESLQVLFAIIFLGFVGSFGFLFVSLFLLGLWTHFFG